MVVAARNLVPLHAFRPENLPCGPFEQPWELSEESTAASADIQFLDLTLTVLRGKTLHGILLALRSESVLLLMSLPKLPYVVA